MTTSDTNRAVLLARARELEAQGYERGSVVDIARRDELLELYAELGQEVVVLEGAVPPDGQECTECLIDANLVTFFIKRT